MASRSSQVLSMAAVLERREARARLVEEDWLIDVDELTELDPWHSCMGVHFFLTRAAWELVEALPFREMRRSSSNARARTLMHAASRALAEPLERDPAVRDYSTHFAAPLRTRADGPCQLLQLAVARQQDGELVAMVSTPEPELERPHLVVSTPRFSRVRTRAPFMERSGPTRNRS